jgi:hypothetical protein
MAAGGGRGVIGAGAVGETAAGGLRKQLGFWWTTRNDEAIEEWRQRQVAGMFSLSEFVKRLKFRLTRWYNRKTGAGQKSFEGLESSFYLPCTMSRPLGIHSYDTIQHLSS